ncbi:Tat pathway signal sequence domain protein [Streptomyces blastmyceticus]|uniref:Tat pathway signal sequence domain protein n=1 Tax=Streptomyces blastmyceticus TaxID=68180 RepID=A0ABP3GC61_9ACTN
MSPESMDRRAVLRTALGAGAALGAVGLTAGAARAATPGTTPAGAGEPGVPDFSPVPGMQGDRRANEFWYQYDQKFYVQPTPETGQAIGKIVGPMGGFQAIWDVWLQHYKGGAYPQSFIDLVAPSRDSLVLLSREQRGVYDTYFAGRPDDLVLAFQEFGQGTLYDPRPTAGNRIHMMNFTPPDPTHSYHRWHMFLRAFALLGIDGDWWTHIHRLAGLGWELHSIAKPRIDATDNPHLSKALVDRLTKKWLKRSPAEIDQAFSVFPYPVDMGR